MTKQNLFIRFMKASLDFVVDVFHITIKKGFLHFFKRWTTSFLAIADMFSRSDTNDSYEDVVHGITEKEIFSYNPEHVNHSMNVHHSEYYDSSNNH